MRGPSCCIGRSSLDGRGVSNTVPDAKGLRSQGNLRLKERQVGCQEPRAVRNALIIGSLAVGCPELGWDSRNPSVLMTEGVEKRKTACPLSCCGRSPPVCGLSKGLPGWSGHASTNRGRAMKKGSEAFGVDTAKVHQMDDDP